MVKNKDKQLIKIIGISEDLIGLLEFFSPYSRESREELTLMLINTPDLTFEQKFSFPEKNGKLFYEILGELNNGNKR